MAFTRITARTRRAFAGAACAALLALAACGGGDPIERFHPARIVSFGDEASLIVPNGSTPDSTSRKYAINWVDTSTTPPSTTYVCANNFIWTQNVASVFNLTFKACPGVNPTGLIYAAPSATVAGVKTQIDSFLAADGPFSHSDVVTVMAGMYDVIEQYLLYPATPEATLVATIQQRGKALAEQVNRVALTGAPVIVLRIPNVGLTPYARQQGADAMRLMSRLSVEFNNALQLNLINDGHLIGLVYADSEVQFVNDNATALNFNVTDAACTAARSATDKLDPSVMLGCTSSTLVDSSNYLWAGNLQLSPYGHTRLGDVAASRALNNPF